MLVSVEKQPNENIIVAQYKAPFNPGVDINEAQRQIAEILDTNPGVFYRIDDLSKALKELGGWGSVEIYVQDGKVTQITKRAIKKTNHRLETSS